MENSWPMKWRPGRRSPGRLLFLILALLAVGTAICLMAGCRSRTSAPIATTVPVPSAAPPVHGSPERGPEPKTGGGEPPRIRADQLKPKERASEAAASKEAGPDSRGRIELELPPEETRPAVAAEEEKPTSDADMRRNAPPASGLPVEIRRGPPSARKIALTFDAGASAAPTPAILAALREQGIRATFFLTGKWVKRNPDLVREIVRDGHEIGNHSYSHTNFRKLTDEQIADELNRTEAAVEQAAGVTTKPYFRPPYGGLDTRVQKAVRNAGYSIVYWSVDSWDSFKKDIKPEEVRRRVLTKSRPGAIVLMHCGSQATAEALPGIIRSLKEEGYSLVPVSELAIQGEP